MSRLMKFPSKELGNIEVMAVASKGGVWEKEWAGLQGTEFEGLFSKLPKHTVDLALHGYTRPLAVGLGLIPEGCLIKLPVLAKSCESQKGCGIYNPKHCFPTTKKLFPRCYEPGGVPEEAREVAALTIRLWRQGVYVLVVEE